MFFGTSAYMHIYVRVSVPWNRSYKQCELSSGAHISTTIMHQ